MKIKNNIEEKNLVLFKEGKNKTDLKDRLNLHYLKYLNTTYTVGKYDSIHFSSPVNAKIDYLALYSQPSEYNKTSNTAVCFFEDDIKFDRKNGLWNAIYYNDSKLIEQYRERFKNVKYFISPDYSQIGDVPFWLNLFNLQRSRIVSLFLVQELNKLVYPLITYSNENSFEYMLDGLEECNVVAFSLKGALKTNEQLDMLFTSLASDELNSNGAISKFTDYRTYMDYDIKIINEFGESMLYSKVFKEKSGGETQVPFYVAIIASFVRIYSQNKTANRDSIGLVIFDEVFDKMDANRMKSMMDFISTMPLQVIIACPPQRTAILQNYADTTLVMMRKNNHASVIPFETNDGYDVGREAN